MGRDVRGENALPGPAAVALMSILLSALVVAGGSDAATNLGVGGAGISFGNSTDWRGLRFNFVDRGVIRVEGVNLIAAGSETGNPDARYRGLTVGLYSGMGRSFSGITIAPGIQGKSISGLSLSLVQQAKDRLAGIHVSGVILGSDDFHVDSRIQGLTVGGFCVMTSGSISGITVGGVFVGARKSVSGVSVGGFTVATPKATGLTLGLWSVYAQRNRGMSFAYFEVGARELRGVAMSTFRVRAEDLQGVGIASYVHADRATGLMIAIVNRTRELHGVQLGLLNFAGNNGGWRRLLPIANAHF